MNQCFGTSGNISPRLENLQGAKKEYEPLKRKIKGAIDRIA